MLGGISMINDYELFQWIQLRQKEIEKKARNAWKQYEGLRGEKSLIKHDFTLKSSIQAPCCNCA